MALEQFPVTDSPDWGLADASEEDVKTHKFGDGYDLRYASGINHQKGVWSVSWDNLSPEDALAAYEWVLPKLKLNAFLWVHPDRGSIQVVCRSARHARMNYNHSRLELTLVEDFNPA